MEGAEVGVASWETKGFRLLPLRSTLTTLALITPDSPLVKVAWQAVGAIARVAACRRRAPTVEPSIPVEGLGTPLCHQYPWQRPPSSPRDLQVWGTGQRRGNPPSSNPPLGVAWPHLPAWLRDRGETG